MAKKKIKVEGIEIRIEPIDNSDYISLTDIAKQQNDPNWKFLIIKWLQNKDSLLFIETWEKINNPNFKVANFGNFKTKYLENRYVATPQKMIAETGIIGIRSKSGRYGGTYAHKDIALEFCGWLSPVFKVYMITEFQRLMEEEFSRKNLEWHISKLTDNVEEMRNLLDTIPGQESERNRLESLKKRKKS